MTYKVVPEIVFKFVCPNCGESQESDLEEGEICEHCGVDVEFVSDESEEGNDDARTSNRAHTQE